MTYRMRSVVSPLGSLTLLASDRGLAALLWEDDDPERVRLAPRVPDGADPLLLDAERQLEEYFAGERSRFDLALDMNGTDFQKRVWTALLDIPFGETRSYADIARTIGRPSASRAVGAANGRNPISIIVPCHRVVGTGGALTGFAGGLKAKRHLLDLEGRSQGRFPI